MENLFFQPAVGYLMNLKLLLQKIKSIGSKHLERTTGFLSPDDIEKKIKSIKSKDIILFLNSPNNPSGAVCKNLKEIAEVAKKHEIIILSDEIYTQLQFDGKYDSISEYYPEGTIVSSGLSKWLGAGGWRLGFFAVPNKLKNIPEMIKILSSESLSAVSAPIQMQLLKHFLMIIQIFKQNEKYILFSW